MSSPRDGMSKIWAIEMSEKGSRMIFEKVYLPERWCSSNEPSLQFWQWKRCSEIHRVLHRARRQVWCPWEVLKMVCKSGRYWERKKGILNTNYQGTSSVEWRGCQDGWWIVCHHRTYCGGGEVKGEWNLFEDNNIIIYRTPSSFSEIHQPVGSRPFSRSHLLANRSSGIDLPEDAISSSSPSSSSLSSASSSASPLPLEEEGAVALRPRFACRSSPSPSSSSSSPSSSISSTAPLLRFETGLALALDSGLVLALRLRGFPSSSSSSSSSSPSSARLGVFLGAALGFFALDAGLAFAEPFGGGPSGFLSLTRASSYLSPRRLLRCLHERALIGQPP